MEQEPVCLTVGGSDSCGGAGIQADLRVFEALELRGCSAITALTAQNPIEIIHIEGSSITQFEAELQAISNFYNVRCLKTGMLYDEEHLNALIAVKQRGLKEALLVVDPVLIASSGRQLFNADQALTVYGELISLATVWTPNLQEAAFFLGSEIDDPIEAASALLMQFRTPVLLKGGHGETTLLRDIFCDIDGSVDIYEHPRQALNRAGLHGTGCRLASAITAYLARGETLAASVSKSHQWLQNNLKDA